MTTITTTTTTTTTAPPPLSYYTLHITRHGYSCANILDTPYSKDTMMDKMNKTSIRMTQSNPSLSMYGIIQTLLVGQARYGQSLFEKDHLSISVSCLVRTWITAFLLYAPHLNSNATQVTMHLIIQPGLREDAMGASNTCPSNWTDAFEKFSHMLKILTNLMFVLQQPQQSDNLKNLKTVFDKLSKFKKIIIWFFFPDNITMYMQFPILDHQISTSDETTKLIKGITTTFSVGEPLKTIQDTSISVTSNSISRNDLSRSSIQDFLSFYHDAVKPTPGEVHYVVAHNNIMRSFVKWAGIWEEESMKSLSRENSWQIILTINENGQIQSLEINRGVAYPSESELQSYRCEPLCQFYDQTKCAEKKSSGGSAKKPVKKRRKRTRRKSIRNK